MKTIKFYLSHIIIIIIISVFFLGCGKQNNNKQPFSEQQENSSVSGVTVATNQNTIVITGTGERSTPKFIMEKGAYIVNFKYRGISGNQFEVFLPSRQSGFPPVSLAPYLGFAKDASGWSNESKIFQWKGEKSDVSLNIKATDEWKIEFYRLPLKDSPLQIPTILAGTGSQVTKLFELKKGQITFDIKCPDTQKAGFMVTLYDGKTGQHVLPEIIIASNVEAGADASKTEYASIKKIDIPYEGLYLLEIAANGNSPWEIKVTL
ncbi:MAG: hypothetical protein ABSG15_08015 [FCB group bacterium]|jgi:hypothetical protein